MRNKRNGETEMCDGGELPEACRSGAAWRALACASVSGQVAR